MTFIGHIRCRW